MERVLNDICNECRNYFKKNIVFGKFRVVDGELLEYDSDEPLDYLQNGQYFRLVGSVFNDGVHKFGSCELQDERDFEGAIWLMAVPIAVINLASEIEEWRAKYEDIESSNMSPFQSESFGGYSYSKGSSGSSSGSNGNTWQSVFRSKLNAWRKIR